MLCKELQYGDWCCNKHGFPMQITNVGEDYAYATWEGNEGDPWEFDIPRICRFRFQCRVLVFSYYFTLRLFANSVIPASRNTCWS